MTRTVRLILEILEPGARRMIAGLLLLFVFMAFVETLSVASILPFMSLVADPDVIAENRILSWIYDKLGFSTQRSFIFYAGLFVLVFMAFSNGMKAATRWGVIRFGWHQQYQLCMRLLSQYMSEPYEYFLERNTADLTKTLFSETGEVIVGLIIPGLQMMAQTIVVCSIFILLLMVDPWLAVISTVILAGAYGSLYGAVRHEQARIGKVRLKVNADRFRLANEALSGIKESKVLGREGGFLERFSYPAHEFTRVSAKNATVMDIPRFALETIAFGGIVLIVLYMVQTRDDFGEIVAVMSLYALAGYRLIPALQVIFSGFARLRFYSAAVESVHEHLRAAAGTVKVAVAALSSGPDERLPFHREIRLESLSYRYPNTEVDVVKQVDMTIPIRRSVGIVGGTGSGKTTLVDLILGLIQPTDGRICVDGTELSLENHRAWRRNLGYVPQEIFLCDDTIARNIAFGLADDTIDDEAVRAAAEAAQVHEFASSLPAGYETIVGERGVRLSGGQRQRIGIARALYHDPDLLILDEATSALDGITERAVMEAVRALSGKKTMVLIAHRLSTLRDCDVIHLFRHGRLAESGCYDELMEKSVEFRSMAMAAESEG